MKAQYYGETNIGKRRQRNEDDFVLTNVWDDTHILAVVVDGVGGYAGGDVAAHMACKCITEHITTIPERTLGKDLLKTAVLYANNSIHEQHCNPYFDKMCCVLTAILIDLESGKADVCHVGDTRLYQLKSKAEEVASSFRKLTRDHSPVGEMEEKGELTESEAMRHPRRNIINRCVGKSHLDWDTDYIDSLSLQLEPSTLLLCSDGLYDMVHSTQTIEILQEATTPQERVEKLINAALEAGGKDNVTVMVIDLHQ